MSISAAQIPLIHIAAKAAGLDRAGYELALRSIGHADSCKQLSQIGYEDVMAFFESRGFIDAKKGAGYWQRQVDMRQKYIDSRTLFKLREFAERQKYDLGGLCLRHSHNRTREPSKLYPDEAWEIIEMLKKVIQREEGIACKSPAKAASFLSGDRRAGSNSPAPSLFPPPVGLPDVNIRPEPSRRASKEPTAAKKVDLSYLGEIKEEEVPF